MVEYIKKIADELYKHINPDVWPENTNIPRQELFHVFIDELNKLNAMDFSPNHRFEFITTRLELKLLDYNANEQQHPKNYNPLYEKLFKQLDNYGGLGTQLIEFEFNYINDSTLREIIKRDYRELSYILFPDGAWKSIVIMAGSILEAILVDRLAADAKKAIKCKYAVQKKLKANDLSNGNWKLVHLIEVADEIGLLPAKRKETIDQVLREYRNFVHANAEIRNSYSINDGEAFMAVGALKSICHDFEERFN